MFRLQLSRDGRDLRVDEQLEQYEGMLVLYGMDKGVSREA